MSQAELRQSEMENPSLNHTTNKYQNLELKSSFLVPVFCSFIYATTGHGHTMKEKREKGQGKNMDKFMTQN